MSTFNKVWMWVSRVGAVAVLFSSWFQMWLANPDWPWLTKAVSVLTLAWIGWASWIGLGVIWQDDWPRRPRRGVR